jgi:selenocysteine lyase/cysteine desulfurase
VAIDVPDALPASRVLKARDVIVDYRPRVGIRVSPHFYNTFDELDRLVQVLAEVLATSAFADAPSSRVT